MKNTSYFYVVLFLYGSYFRMTLWKVFLPFCTNSLPSVKRSAVTLKSISFMGCSASFTPPCCTARLPSEREGTTLIVVSSVRISMPSANSAAEISVEGHPRLQHPYRTMLLRHPVLWLLLLRHVRFLSAQRQGLPLHD